jgi:hypothetical protein
MTSTPFGSSFGRFPVAHIGLVILVGRVVLGLVVLVVATNVIRVLDIVRIGRRNVRDAEHEVRPVPHQGPEPTASDLRVEPGLTDGLGEAPIVEHEVRERVLDGRAGVAVRHALHVAPEPLADVVAGVPRPHRSVVVAPAGEDAGGPLDGGEHLVGIVAARLDHLGQDAPHHLAVTQVGLARRVHEERDRVGIPVISQNHSPT